MKKDEDKLTFEVELAEDVDALDAPAAPEVQEDDDIPVATQQPTAEDEDADRPLSGWRRLFQSEDLPQLSLREILGGDLLLGHFLRRQIRFILLLMVLGIAYITNRYVAQQEIILEENLRKELTEKKNYMLTQYSELTEQSRQSMLEQRLWANGDSSLVAPKEPPFFIPRK